MERHSIRQATPRDAAGLVACIDAAYAEHAARIPDLPAVSADVPEHLAASQVWVATRGGEIVGGLIIQPQAGFMQLVNVAVHPGQRGTGLGRTLLAHAEGAAREQGFTEIRLTTHVDMTGNLGIYLHLGWAEEKREGNRVFMTKIL